MCFKKLPNIILGCHGKLLISNGAELFRIDGGVGRAKISQNGGFSLKHKYLSGIVSYEADAVEKYHTAVTDFFCLKNVFEYHLYT